MAAPFPDETVCSKLAREYFNKFPMSSLSSHFNTCYMHHITAQDLLVRNKAHTTHSTHIRMYPPIESCTTYSCQGCSVTRQHWDEQDPHFNISCVIQVQLQSDYMGNILHFSCPLNIIHDVFVQWKPYLPIRLDPQYHYHHLHKLAKPAQQLYLQRAQIQCWWAQSDGRWTYACIFHDNEVRSW